MEDGGSQIGWVWGWSGVGWPDRRSVVAAKSVVKIGIELGALANKIGGSI